MDKKQAARFLKEGRRGIYPLIVSLYKDDINSLGPAMALIIIKDDLEKESGEVIDINYTSLAHAMKKHKSERKTDSKTEAAKKIVFLDEHEIKEKQLPAGGFKLAPKTATNSQDVKSKAN